MRCEMVMLATRDPIPTYRVYEDDGRPIGQVLLPTTDRLAGPGAETILLRRRMPDLLH
jgi:hypothetical protein